jgi:uncharacterized metal-binding protein YceD (DUF177 family)
MSPPEFSRPVRLPQERRRVELLATAAECNALAERFGIPGVAHFRAVVELTPESSGRVLARGTLEARVTQTCVVTLEPVAQKVVAPLDLVILAEGEVPADDDPESPDEIERHQGQVDLGEACAEQLALALDPYPRHPEAVLPAFDPEPEPVAPPKRPNPFAALAPIKRS